MYLESRDLDLLCYDTRKWGCPDKKLGEARQEIGGTETQTVDDP